MKKEWAVFNGNRLVCRYWTRGEAESECGDNGHVRRWFDGWRSKGCWTKNFK